MDSPAAVPCPPGRVIQCWHSRLSSLEGAPNEDGWYLGPGSWQPAPSQTIESLRDSVWQGGDPDRCPEVSGKRLLLTEAQMDINVYRPCKHFSAETVLFQGLGLALEWEGERPAFSLTALPLPGSLGLANHLHPAPVLIGLQGDSFRFSGVVFHQACPNP